MQLGGKDSLQGGGSRTGQARQWLEDPRGDGWRTQRSHILEQINWEEQRGRETELATPELQLEEIKPQSTD